MGRKARSPPATAIGSARGSAGISETTHRSLHRSARFPPFARQVRALLLGRTVSSAGATLNKIGLSAAVLFAATSASMVSGESSTLSGSPLACQPEPGQMASLVLADGSFRRISGTILVQQAGGEEIPIVALQAISTESDPRLVTLVFRNNLPLNPSGHRYPVYSVSFDEGGGRPPPAGELARYVNFGGPVQFVFENPGPNRFSYRATSSDPDGTPITFEGTIETSPFEIRDVALLCVGVPIELRNLRVER